MSRGARRVDLSQLIVNQVGGRSAECGGMRRIIRVASVLCVGGRLAAIGGMQVHSTGWAWPISPARARFGIRRLGMRDPGILEPECLRQVFSQWSLQMALLHNETIDAVTTVIREEGALVSILLNNSSVSPSFRSSFCLLAFAMLPSLK